jgi:hypothetical protein
MKPKYLLLVLLVVMGSSSRLLAWSKAGHMATGSLAYQALVANPADAPVAQAIANLLEKHPFVEGPWKPLLAAPSGNITRAEKLFMLAAQWPDEARGAKWKKKYHHAKWHYVNFVYEPGVPFNGQSLGGDILPQLSANLATASKAGASAEERAIAICWVLHLIGDLHQPLHVVALVVDGDADGDRGGNQFFVKTKASGAPTKLHSLWDGLGIPRQTDFVKVHNNSVKLRTSHPRSAFPQLTGIPANNFTRIAKTETYLIAVKSAYLEGRLTGADEHEAEDDPELVPVLPSDYLTNAGKIASAQLSLSGFRAAVLFTDIVR